VGDELRTVVETDVPRCFFFVCERLKASDDPVCVDGTLYKALAVSSSITFRNFSILA